MKSSLEQYSINEIEKMENIPGERNYDTYDKIMYHVCREFNEILENDALLRENLDAYINIKTLTFFMTSFVYNKKMRLTDVEKFKLEKTIDRIDHYAKGNNKCPTYKAYNEAYRNCVMEFLSKSAKFEMNKSNDSNIRK